MLREYEDKAGGEQKKARQGTEEQKARRWKTTCCLIVHGYARVCAQEDILTSLSIYISIRKNSHRATLAN